MKQLLSVALATALAAIATTQAASTRPVDVVVVIDTSGSMEHLLDAARARIWDVVNELGGLRPTPRLRVGLISFGTDKTGQPEGYLINHIGLTEELDHVYAELMGLTIGGGEELVGRALNEALNGMHWSSDPEALRVIFVAGNEFADQGVQHNDFRVEGRTAQERDIIVNALYAGTRENGVVDLWHEVAQAGLGNFSAIDPSTASIQIETPQDETLLALNRSLNTTYVPYGKNAQAGMDNQIAQDSNASRLGVQSCSSRIVAKGGALYNNASWDLVDRTLQEGFHWDDVLSSDLPDELQSMSTVELAAFVEAKRAEREAIQRKIQDASAAREAFLQAALARSIGESGLGEAMRKAIRDQAIAKGFSCDGC